VATPLKNSSSPAEVGAVSRNRSSGGIHDGRYSCGSRAVPAVRSYARVHQELSILCIRYRRPGSQRASSKPSFTSLSSSCLRWPGDVDEGIRWFKAILFEFKSGSNPPNPRCGSKAGGPRSEAGKDARAPRRPCATLVQVDGSVRGRLTGGLDHVDNLAQLLSRAGSQVPRQVIGPLPAHSLTAFAADSREGLLAFARSH
jgi:hypothetical protein